MFSVEGKFFIHLIAAILLCLPVLKCTNPFESVPIRANCFHKTPKPCRMTKSHVSSTTPNGNDPDTHAYLFTRSNPDEPEFLHECGFELGEASNFNATCPTKILIHGYAFGMCTLAIFREIKDQILIKGEYNVILIDWTWGCQGDYYDALQNLKVVAAQVATLAKKIMHQTGVHRKSFHTIGHSLGCHIAGMVGNSVKLGRITGVEPSGRSFGENVPAENRLDISDAHLVDVIHTNMGSCFPTIGNDYQTGHADFIVNGGRFQPSCYVTMMTSLVKGDWFYGATHLIYSICSHWQALEYFKASINPGSCEFVGVNCQDYADFKSGQCHSCQDSLCAVMGMDFEKYITKDVRRAFPISFYVDTDFLCPYCNNDRLKLHGFPNSTSSHHP